ncbi:hypothetical protein [Streptomyces sp. NPDC005407]|uniref:hypothetical protein n=1 Tax=Streptomyces sp. NPDC005407 TaxID=3155340 RepID=UPI0033A766D4
MTAPTITPNSADHSWDAGYTDGELDAFSKLPEDMARARAEMAEDYDPLWAAAYWTAYENLAAVLDAMTEKTATPSARLIVTPKRGAA